MDIVIISEFGDDYSKSDNDRFLYLAKLLVNELNTNNIEIITSSFRHTTKRHRKETVEDWPFKITFIDEPGYPRNVCLKRFYSHYVWGRNVKKYLQKRKKPDVIYCAIPSLSGPNWVARYCDKHGVKFIIDIQDLWPEAFQMVFNISFLSDIVFLPFKKLADGIYKRADAICAVSDTYCRRALKVNKKVKDTTTVFLGTELATFDRYAAEHPIIEKRNDEIWLAYCGTLGSSYDLTCVIDALDIIKDERIRFIVMGDGPMKDKFEDYAKEKKINSVFVGRLPYDSMISLLSACDLNINPITHMAAQSIINKHADYAASGNPVVSTQENEEYRELIDNYNMGFNCRNNDSVDLAEKIRILSHDCSLREKLGNNARICAEEKFDRTRTYKRLVMLVKNALNYKEKFK